MNVLFIGFLNAPPYETHSFYILYRPRNRLYNFSIKISLLQLWSGLQFKENISQFI